MLEVDQLRAPPEDYYVLPLILATSLPPWARDSRHLTHASKPFRAESEESHSLSSRGNLEIQVHLYNTVGKSRDLNRSRLPKQTMMNNTRMQDDKPLTDPAFRPAKRRKFYRRRDNSDSNPEPHGITSLPLGGISAQTPTTLEELVKQARDSTDMVHEDDGEPQLLVAEVLRRRRAARNRRGGIEFSNVGHNTKLSSEPAHSTDALALVDKDDTMAVVKTVVNRFAPQTGQVADVDKHM